jgi:hypothetical protein
MDIAITMVKILLEHALKTPPPHHTQFPCPAQAAEMRHDPPEFLF